MGGKHSTFDGYAVGQTVELQPGRRIVQTWRAEDFPLGSPDSRVEVTLEETKGGTMVTILHTDIPSGQSSNYRDGWLKYYLEPLKGYFVASTAGEQRRPEEGAEGEAAPASARKPAPKRRPTAKKPTQAGLREGRALQRSAGTTKKKVAKTKAGSSKRKRASCARSLARVLTFPVAKR